MPGTRDRFLRVSGTWEDAVSEAVTGGMEGIRLQKYVVASVNLKLFFCKFIFPSQLTYNIY